MSEVEPVAPILKWAGGKRALIGKIEKFFPEISTHNSYHEPFLGGGAIFFSRTGQHKIHGYDLNEELINLYKVIEDSPRELVAELKSGRYINDREHFESIRAWDRNESWATIYDPIERASRIIFLNKTCFNGLYRVNSKGEFNVPFGNNKNFNLDDQENKIYAMSAFLNSKLPGGTKRATINQMGYRESLDPSINKFIKKGDLIYLDPPYEPISKTANFISYTHNVEPTDAFSLKELFTMAKRLVKDKGVTVVISNSGAKKAGDLARRHGFAQKFKDEEAVVVRRFVGASPKSRVPVSECLFISPHK